MALEERVLISVNILGIRWVPNLSRAPGILLRRDASATMVGRTQKVQNGMKQYNILLYIYFLLGVLEEAPILRCMYNYFIRRYLQLIHAWC